MNRESQVDRTALSYWFPLIEAAGVPVPKTKIIAMPKEAQAVIWAAFDGKNGLDLSEWKNFQEQVRAIGSEFGYPLFLRTDHTSGKHEWNRTCFLKSPDDVAQHLFNIAEHSEICDFIGLPWDTWVVREYLPIIPYGSCPHYGNMPLCREFRFFVNDGAVRCWHPYWPTEALERGGAERVNYEALCRMDDEPALAALATKAGKAVGGAWSVDILETERGWYVTDMAEAHKSFHWEGCEANT
jgi:hypothetical protein